MWFRMILLALMIVPFMALAQVQDYQTPGNLAPTHKVGCVDLAGAKAEYSPADLALGVVACAKHGDYDKAVDLFIVMQLRAVYDSKRVKDKSAHQAAQVIAMQIRETLGARKMRKLEAAFEAFGDNGSPRHQVLCKEMKRVGPPDYHPAYMIRHGMSAVLGRSGNGIVKEFRPKPAWRDLLTGYMKCGGA